jgi:zinc protease
MKYSIYGSMALAMLLGNPLHAQRLPLDTAVHTGKLPNGFSYYIRHNEQPKGRVYLYLVNKVGSVLEDDDQQGLAHFMEHMNFNGTTHFPKNELVNYLQKSGVRFGADLNAYTSFDETVFQLPIPSDDPQILKNGFQIMRDWAQEATLDSLEIDKERGVVIEEERLGRGAQERMQRLFFPPLLNYSRYAERIPIGKLDILQHFPPSAIRRFHDDWYRPDLQALIVVGDIDPAQTELLVRQLFADLKNPPNEKQRTKYTVPLAGNGRFIVVTDPEMPVTNLEILIKRSGRELETEEDYLEIMKKQLFNQMLGEKFSKRAQRPDLPYLGAEAKLDKMPGGLSVFDVNIILKKGNWKQGVQDVWGFIQELKKDAFTNDELNRAKENYLTGMGTGYRERDKTSSDNYVNEYKRLFLENEASPGISWEYNFVKTHIDQISLPELNKMTADWISDKNRDIVLLASDNDKNELPDSATVISWMRQDSHSIGSLSSDQKKPLMETEPSPGFVVKTLRFDVQGITEYHLSNGATVILKPTDFKNDEIRFAAFSSGGTSVYTDAQFINASYAGMVSNFGLGALNPSALNQALTGKLVRVSPFINERFQGLDGTTTPEDLKTAMQMVHLYFTQPRKDKAIFDNDINAETELLSTRYRDPNNTFEDSIKFVLGNYSLRRRTPDSTDLKTLNLDEVYQIYKERFSDASGFTFVFVGNFKTEAMLPLVEKYIGSLPARHRNETARDLGIHIPSGIMTKKIIKGSENKAMIRMVYSGPFNYNASNLLALNALRSALQIKIVQHLREDQSEVYSPSVKMASVKYPASRYAFTVAFGCAPANAEGLMRAVDNELTQLREHGPTQEDLDKFKVEYTRLREIKLADNGYWLSAIGDLYQNHGDPVELDMPLDGLNNLTTQSLKKAANEWLSGKNEIRFELLPEHL